MGFESGEEVTDRHELFIPDGISFEDAFKVGNQHLAMQKELLLLYRDYNNVMDRHNAFSGALNDYAADYIAIPWWKFWTKRKVEREMLLSIIGLYCKSYPKGWTYTLNMGE
jgi:hypothetical protein